MKKSTKITLDELIKRKQQVLAAKKKRATLELYVPSLDGSITIEEPDAAVIQDAAGMEPGEGDAYLCYKCVKNPDLSSAELQTAYGCAEPTDIVQIIFKPGEIQQISVKCMELAGYTDSVKPVETVKN